MTSNQEPDPASRAPRGVVAAAVLALLLTMAAGVAFARADQGSRIAADALVVRESERAMGETTSYRAALTIAVVAAAEDPSAAATVDALAAAGWSVDTLSASVDALDVALLSALVEELDARHARIVTAVSDADVATADEIASTESVPRLDRLRTELAAVSGAATARIEAEQASAGTSARLSSFVVALIAPALGLWAFRSMSRRRLERERLLAELARQRDVARVQDELIAGLSHELRTPLTGIYGFAEAMLDEGEHERPDAGLMREGSRTILDQANALRRMLDDILVTARVPSGELAFDLAPFDLAAEVAAAVEPFARTGHEVEVLCEPTVLIGDRLRLRHVLRNLIDNALRHGGGPVRVVGVREDGYRLAVEDDGPGVDDPSSLFRAFAHSGRDALVTGSLGLGLSVVRELCTGMGATVTHERTGPTTRFVVGWPSEALGIREPHSPTHVASA